MTQRASKKTANSLVALSSAAVLAVYAAGYSRTRTAADQLEAQFSERRPPVPAPARTAPVPAAIAPPPSPIPVKTIASAVPVPEHKVSPKAAVVSEPPAVHPAEPAVPEPTFAPAPVVPAEAPVPVAPPPVPAPAAAPTPAAAPATSAQGWKDGLYFGWGSSRHGDIQAAVQIDGGRITSATINQCLTRYSCDVIAKLPPEVAERQSPDVDYVSGATQSANAFYHAVVDALGQAK